ncbi:uncharacterized protein BDV14DRAFT_201269 [Aspergillus stella-maris]|uniref:uncharacterized protein n=1 Tax=Aspergillus stella-maris TaxID=1810926 RepID=UPI003CCCDB60
MPRTKQTVPAPAPIDKLSYEILDKIILYLASPVEYKVPSKPKYLDIESTFPSTPNKCNGLAQYAAVSKKWKEAVERFTFNTLSVSSDDLLRLSTNMRHFNRWKSLGNLFCTIQLPSYSHNRRSNFERRREHQANLVAFRKALPLLYQAIGSYHNFHRALSSLRLAITADAPVDPPNEDESNEGRVQRDLGALRWSNPEHTLTLSDGQKGPQPFARLVNVSHLSIAKTGRRIQPLALRPMIYNMPSLRKLDIRIPPVQARNKDLRASMRNDLAAVLDDWALEQLEYLSIEMEDSTPQNHMFSIASGLDENYPAGDHLSRAVCKLAQTNLRELYMGPEVLISPVLFGVDPLRPELVEETFPHLTRMQVNYALVAYDGRWYYDGDGEENPDDFDWEIPPRDSESDSEDDSATNSSYNSEYADNLNEERKEYLNGNRPYYSYRKIPNALFNDLIKSVVSAVNRMPNIRALEVKTNNPGYNEYQIGVEYVSPWYRALGTMGVGQYESEEMLAMKRYVLSYEYAVEWDVPSDLLEMMRDQVEEGEGKGQVITV